MEKRIVARGQGHRSWVSVVAFDPFTTSYGDHDPDFSGSDDELSMSHNNHILEKPKRSSIASHSNRNSCSSELRVSSTCYRLGSVSHDTQLCLWDINEDELRQPVCSKNRTSSISGASSSMFNSSGTFNSGNGAMSNHHLSNSKHINSNNIGFKENAHSGSSGGFVSSSGSSSGNNGDSNNTVNSLTQRLAGGLGFGERKNDNHKRNFSLTLRGSGTTGGGVSGVSGNNTNNVNVIQNSVVDKNNAGSSSSSSGGSTNTSNVNSVVNSLCASKKVNSVMDDPIKLIGTPSCPRFWECPVLEPIVCKKLAHERLTELVFKEDCFVTACNDGYVYTFARPGQMVGHLTISNTLHKTNNHSHSPYSSSSIRPSEL